MLDEFGYSHVQGTTWTTDAFYRETRAKVEARKRMGAVCVEMECAAVRSEERRVGKESATMGRSRWGPGR